MATYEAYGTTIEITETSVELVRTGLLASVVAQLVSVPLDAIVETRFSPPRRLSNGTLQLVLEGNEPVKPNPKDPYTIVFRRNQVETMSELHDVLDRRARANAAIPQSARPPIVRTIGGPGTRPLRMEERLDGTEGRGRFPTFEGIQLVGGAVFHSDGGGPVAGATAVVGSAEEIHRRITASRIVLVGPFALDRRKKTGDGELSLLIIGVDWAIAVRVPASKIREGRAFAAQVNAAGGTGTPAAGATEPSPVEQIEQLADLRDRGILSDDEFQAKKQELLRRL